MRDTACNWSPRYLPREELPETEEVADNAYTVVWLMGLNDGSGVVRQTHVYAPDCAAAHTSVMNGELRSCEGRVLAVLRGHLQGGT